MSAFLTFMAAPAVGCVILALVFTYFGLHVLKREVIFVDLSLAQLAALGATLGFALEWDAHSWGAQGLSLLFILLGALFFAVVEYRFPEVSQEAVIGIVYVVGASLAIIIADQAPHAAEHIQFMLNGSILWITWSGVATLAVTAAGVGLLAWKWRKPIETWFDRKTTAPRSYKRALWDFAFYTLLGAVIAVSIKTAGIFLVFTLLIIPAVCATLFANTLYRQFVLGSVIGAAGSLAGLALSFSLDVPTGAMIVTTFGGLFGLALIFRLIRNGLQ
ncbi:metal ABC transporter permease [Nitrospina watsonii]|uniref:ABC-type metal ion ABC transporter, permease component n=1 Tax=Nitrospina watsonii TaxID=1323948 RepID=A0ABM9HEE3_9BACT|nr:metal ABC transporter permease [Nitrospina watsonii]CAI2718619.1 Putative ABC-type metal ion ABC transporter, permease component [Nitrospina watsonii]